MPKPTTTVVAPAVDFDVDALDATFEGSLSLQEAAKACRVSRPTVQRWMRLGLADRAGTVHRLPAFRMGSRRMIRKADLRDFLAAIA